MTADSGITQGVDQYSPSASFGPSVGYDDAHRIRRVAPFADVMAPAMVDSQAFARKPEFGAFMYSLLLAGGGQLCAGERTMGAALILMEVGDAGLAVGSVMECDNLPSDDCIDVPVVLGLSLALGSWIYSMVDAAGLRGGTTRSTRWRSRSSTSRRGVGQGVGG